MASNTTSLLPGQSAPLAVITSTSQGGIVTIATALGLTFGLISILLRFFIRLEFHNKLERDDLAITIAMIFSVFQSVVVFLEVSKGFGKTLLDIAPIALVSLQKLAYSSDLLYIVTLWLTKCSLALLFLRLSPNKGHVIASALNLTTATLFMFISIFIVALRCNLAHPWIFISPQCADFYNRWQVTAAFDVATEVALFSTSIYLVQGLQLPLKKKAVVVVAFGLRLPFPIIRVLVPIAVRLHYLRFEILSSNPTLDGVSASVWTQIQLSYAVIAATTPCLRPFMTALSTNYGAPAEPKQPKSAKGSGWATNEIPLSSLSKLSTLGGSGKGKPVSVPKTRWDLGEHEVSVMSGDQHSMESHESKQMIISKNIEWAVEFEEPNRSI